MAEYEGQPSKGPGSGRRSRRTANRKARAIETQAVEAPSGGDYGSRVDSEDAQRAIPLPKADLAAALAAAQQAAPPGETLGAPSSRPQEPVTAGLPSGPGPGPEALSHGVSGNPDIEMVRALYRQFPTEAVRRVLERLDREVGPDRPVAPSGPRPRPGSDAADQDKPPGDPLFGTGLHGSGDGRWRPPSVYKPSPMIKQGEPLEPKGPDL